MPRNLNHTRAYHRQRRRTAKAAGLCITCQRNPAAAGRVSCEPCATRARERNAIRQRRLRAAHRLMGICTACNQRLAITGQTVCGVCAEARDERRAMHRAAGLCIDCPSPAREGITRCARCAASAVAHRRRAA